MSIDPAAEASTEAITHAPEVTGARLARAKTINIVAGSLGMLWATVVFGMYFNNYLRELGASNFQIGLLGALPPFCGVLQILGALTVVHLNRRRPFWVLTALAHRVLWVGVVVLPYILGVGSSAVVLWVLAFIGLSQVLAAISTPAWFSWMGDLIAERERGRFFGRRQVFVNGAALLAQPAVGWTLDHFGGTHWLTGFTIVLSIAVVAGCSDIVIHSFIPEPPFVRPDRKLRLLQLLRAPFANPDFRRFIIPAAFFNFTMALTAPFIPIWYREILKMDYKYMAVLTSISLLVTVLSSRFWGYLSDLFGHRPTLILSAWIWMIFPTAYLFTTVGNYPYILPILWVLNGVYVSGWGLGLTNIMLGLSPRENRDVYVGVFWAILGVVGGCGSLLGGALLQTVRTPWLPGSWMTGFQNLFLVGALLGLISMFLLHRIRYRAERSVGFVIGRLMSSNPVRSFGYVNIINAGTSERRKVRAMQQLASMRSRLATSDLIARLDDPSLEVREEAATALGRIGDREAADALIEAFMKPDSYIEMQTCRALGLIGDTRAVEPLLSRLSTAPRDLKAEICRALGEIGDRRAAEPLLELVRSVDFDTRVRAAAVQALGRMGARAALWEILPILRSTENAVIRRQLCLSVGDLLGRREEFYPVLLGEMSVHGSRARRLLKRAARATRVLGEPASAEIARQLARMRKTYDDEDYQTCVLQLVELMTYLARTIFGYSGDIRHLAEAAVLYDSRFGMACWYVELLHESSTSGTRPLFEDVLLGFYFLANWDYHSDQTTSAP